jgi:hypothetical protein
MKNLIIGCVIILSVGLLGSQAVRAQGTTYLSNVGQPSAGSLAVGSDSWLATGFFTGNNIGGYVLDSVQLGLTDATRNPSGLLAMLYDEGGLSVPAPGSSLGTLNGPSDPTTTGVYTFTPSAAITLSPSKNYYVVLTAGSAVANGAYNWSYAGANSYNPGGGWSSRGGSFFVSSDGSRWGPGSVVGPQYAINATPVPEPGVLSLLGLGALSFLWHRRRAERCR